MKEVLDRYLATDIMLSPQNTAHTEGPGWQVLLQGGGAHYVVDPYIYELMAEPGFACWNWAAYRAALASLERQ